MLIGITGATGFIGTRLVLELIRRGHRVLGFGRRSDAVLPVGAVYTPWDLALGPLEAPLQQHVDAIVHCAASVSDWGADQTFHAVNVEGTRAVLEAFHSAPRFIHVSSASVYDPWVSKDQVGEDGGYPGRYQNAYARTKMLTPYVVGQLSSEYTLDIRLAQRVLGYSPPFTYRNAPLTE